MKINTLKDLLSHPAVKILAQAQAIRNDQNYELTNCTMALSPYQVLAWLIMWHLTADQSKHIIVRLLNNRCQMAEAMQDFSLSGEEGFATSYNFKELSVKDLDALVGEINWQQLAAELNATAEDFLEISLPPDIMKELADMHLNLALQSFLTVSDSDYIVIKTSNNIRLRWEKPLDNWQIPENTFVLSPKLMARIEEKMNDLRNEKLISDTFNLGVFHITLQQEPIRSHTPVMDSFYIGLAIHRAMAGLSTELTALEVPSELYQSFVGNSFITGQIICKVRAELQGNSFLTQSGVGMTPSPKLRPLEFKPPIYQRAPYQPHIRCDIKITSIYALYTDALVLVKYQPLAFIASEEDCSEYYVSLKGSSVFSSSFKKDAVRFYAQNPTNIQIIDAFLATMPPKVPSKAALHQPANPIARSMNERMHSCSMM